jgi:hypothetical protein
VNSERQNEFISAARFLLCGPSVDGITVDFAVPSKKTDNFSSAMIRAAAFLRFP